MSRILEFIDVIKAHMPVIQTQVARDDAYLAESVDIYDLERRMREIDQRGQNRSHYLGLSAGLR
jgi:Protein of unknown function (DUF3563)